MDTKVESRGMGGSLPVENVQALASKNLKHIPSRYIRPELVNHGVPDEVIEKMKIDTQEFFKLPLEEKTKCAQIPNEIEGYGQTLVMSKDQKLDWNDVLFVFPLPVPLRNMRFWPNNPPSFRATLEKYSMELHELVKLIAKNLETDLEKFSNFFKDSLNATVQVNEVEGLQIKKNEKWVPVKPIPGALIVNIGDMIEIISNGEYKSVEPKAVVNQEKERLSIAAFHIPKNSTRIGPLPDLVKRNKALYKTMLLEEFLTLRLSRKINGKHLLDQVKL
ncbi:Peroxidase superfamily protein [Hibiscus syriacus]|uniref:Peroxidase superfamily protein n=1 Tax=Hibiscus syriacus TaxID=106335 RepID=A0A6A2YEY3_HIBSY|nr:Peroxidase superfamily protein [Hibiscus syriacus]